MALGAEAGASGSRRWRGQEPRDRTAGRRAQLIEAGLELLGTHGAAAVTMRGVCRQAKLTERYFYESFTARDEFLVAVLDTVVLTIQDRLATLLKNASAEPGPLTRQAVRVFTEFIREDPRRGRVMFVEAVAAPELAHRRGELVAEFTTPIAYALGARGFAATMSDELDRNLNATAVFGALAYLYQEWLAGGFDIEHERFIEHVSQVIEKIALAQTGNRAE